MSNITRGKFTRLSVRHWRFAVITVAADYVCMSVLQGGFCSWVIINWVINGCNVTRGSESGAAESLSYCRPLMLQHLCTVSPVSLGLTCVVLSTTIWLIFPCRLIANHVWTKFIFVGFVCLFFCSGYKTGSKLTTMMHVGKV